MDQMDQMDQLLTDTHMVLDKIADMGSDGTGLCLAVVVIFLAVWSGRLDR